MYTCNIYVSKHAHVYLRRRQFMVESSMVDGAIHAPLRFRSSSTVSLKAQLPIYWVPVLKSLYNFILSGTKGPTIWVPGLVGYYWRGIGYVRWCKISCIRSILVSE